MKLETVLASGDFNHPEPLRIDQFQPFKINHFIERAIVFSDIGVKLMYANATVKSQSWKTKKTMT